MAGKAKKTKIKDLPLDKKVTEKDLKVVGAASLGGKKKTS